VDSSSSAFSSPGREAVIEHRAAEWLAKRDRGLTATEQDELFQWLAEDPRHGEWFARHQQTVNGLKVLAQWRPEHGTRPNPDLLAQPPARSDARARRLAWWSAGALAAAASLALAFTVWRGAESPAEKKVSADTDAKIAIEAAPVLRRLLEDGSSIDLNHGAEVEVQFTVEERRVRLVRGEAHFTVAKNPLRPFVVQANGVSVRAVGTAFDVRLEAAAVEVLVTEGRVSVNPPTRVAALAGDAAKADAAPAAEPAFVGVGERAVVSLVVSGAAPVVTAVAPAEMARLLAWQPRQLEFADAPLAQVVAEFNRDNRVKLVVADPILAALPIGATLRSDNVEGFVRLLETSFQVAVERRSDGVIVLRRAAPSGGR
jgi:transmembrane sensor